MLAIIADSPSLARTQLSDAIAFAREQAIPLEVSRDLGTRSPGIRPQRFAALFLLQR